MQEPLRDIVPGYKEGRILVAEDHPIDQRVVQLLLQRAGYSVDVVWNGHQAVAALHARNYDLVLMDCLMPEMDGLEAARYIRKVEEYQPVIIAVTAYMKEGYREQCLRSGMDDYLSKPYQRQQLLQVIQAHLERSRQLRVRDHQ